MPSRKLSTLFALLVVMLVSAREVLASDDATKSQAIYAHPVVTLVTAPTDTFLTQVAVTWERELGKGRSLTLQPNLAFGSMKNSHIDAPKYAEVGAQFRAAYRLYFNGQVSEGFYTAPAVGLLYLHASRAEYTDRYDDTYRAATAYATAIGFLAYAGYRAKWESFTLYFDLGGGWQFVSATADNGYTISKSGTLIDANLGLGIPF